MDKPPPLPYRQRAVRDLAWACFSGPLIDWRQLPEEADAPGNAGFTLCSRRRDWLAALDRDPAPLLAHLEPRPGRLGLYFEKLWHFFLQRDPEVELLAHNHPVREDGRTLGEFDLLYYCHRRRRHCHLELAVKYYLAHGAIAEGADDRPGPWSLWLGPNSRDRLDIKLRRLLDHQSRLSRLPRGQAVLAQLGVKEPPLREVEMKGYLFRHPGDRHHPPPGFNPARSVARWWRPAELPTALEAAGRYRILPREQWLAPALAGPSEPGVGREELLEMLDTRFRERRAPALVAALDGTGAEQARFFAVDERWPDRD